MNICWLCSAVGTNAPSTGLSKGAIYSESGEADRSTVNAARLTISYERAWVMRAQKKAAQWISRSLVRSGGTASWYHVLWFIERRQRSINNETTQPSSESWFMYSIRLPNFYSLHALISLSYSRQQQEEKRQRRVRHVMWPRKVSTTPTLTRCVSVKIEQFSD